MGTSLRSLPHSDGHSEATSKRSRQSTRLRSLTLRTMDQPRLIVNLNPAGFGVTISQYYGRASRASSNSSISISQQQLAEMIGSLKEQWRNKIIGTLKEEMRSQVEEKNRRSLEKMKQELKDTTKIEFSQRGSQYSPPNEADIQQLGARISTKGSNAETGVNLSVEDVADVIPRDKSLNISVLQLWMMFMDEWSSSFGHGSVYAFLEPQSLHNVK
ncbi:hypothetical protein GmHk_10G029137 [Glycine max]|nr:hypothetical protein GmHk_10G029137 [Glycine max]